MLFWDKVTQLDFVKFMYIQVVWKSYRSKLCKNHARRSWLCKTHVCHSWCAKFMHGQSDRAKNMHIQVDLVCAKVMHVQVLQKLCLCPFWPSVQSNSTFVQKSCTAKLCKNQASVLWPRIQSNLNFVQKSRIATLWCKHHARSSRWVQRYIVFVYCNAR